MAVPAKKQAARELGAQGEALVAEWYRSRGYTIVEQNWRCFEGELDLIARRGRMIAICEVKTRTSGRFIDPALSITQRKQAKVRTAAFRWREDAQPNGRLRFDVALVVGGKIQMIEAAF